MDRIHIDPDGKRLYEGT